MLWAEAMGFEGNARGAVMFGGKADSLGSAFIDQAWVGDGSDWVQA